jgi:hypothetical protein
MENKMEIIFTLKNNERVKLRATEQNYELCRPRTRKNKMTGEVTEDWEACKWFGSLDSALARIIDMKIRLSDATTLKELAVDLAAAREEIRLAWSTEIKAA